MKKLKENILNGFERRIRHICGQPTPAKRFIIMMVIVIVLGAINICLLINSIYDIGKADAESDFLELQHIQQFDLHGNGNDSINHLKQQIHE